MDKIFLGLLIFVPLTLIASFLHISQLIIFFISAIAIIPLAKYIGEATEELATYTNPALGGLLNATFGNATELIIGIFAIRAGLIDVVRASITGSIIGNLLLVLGTAIFVGGWRYKKQVFNRTGAMAGSATLLLTAIALIMLAIFVQTSPGVDSQTINKLSVLVSILMIAVYAASLFFSLFTHKHLYMDEAGVGEVEAKWSITKSLLILSAATIAVALMSEILVGAIRPIVDSFGWTELFIGVIFVAIIGNAAEHTSAIIMAMKNRMDLALQVSVGSATQIAMLVAPVLVIISIFLGKPMNLIFNTFQLSAIIMSILVANIVVQDGESNWLEGIQLLMAYIIIAVAFFFHP